MNKNIFEKIRDGEEKADIVYKDDYITAFKDIHPNAPVHILIIPNKKMESLNEIQEEDSGYLSNILLAAKKIAKQFNVDQTGYRLITNCGSDGGQEINYLHFHLVGGLPLGRMIGLQKDSQKLFKKFKEDKKLII